MVGVKSPSRAAVLAQSVHRFVRDPPHYVLIVNANVFSFDEGVPPYEFVLLKREYGRREVLGTFDNIDTALGAIKLVLSNVQEEYDNFDRS